MPVIRRFFTDAVLPACLVIAVLYNIMLGANGSEGLRMYQALQHEKMKEEERHAALVLESQSLQRRADMLSLRSLNQDFLDERVRRLLGMAQSDEFVLPVEEFDHLLTD